MHNNYKLYNYVLCIYVRVCESKKIIQEMARVPPFIELSRIPHNTFGSRGTQVPQFYVNMLYLRTCICMEIYKITHEMTSVPPFIKDAPPTT